MDLSMEEGRVRNKAEVEMGRFKWEARKGDFEDEFLQVHCGAIEAVEVLFAVLIDLDTIRIGVGGARRVALDELAKSGLNAVELIGISLLI